MPIKDLADACVHFKVDYIVLALTELPADREIISSINFIRKLDQFLPQRVTFCLGGKSFDLTKLETKREMIFFQSFEELDQFFEGIS